MRLTGRIVIAPSGLMNGIVSGWPDPGDRAARAVDVEQDVLYGISARRNGICADDEIGDLVVDGRAEEDDAVP